MTSLRKATQQALEALGEIEWSNNSQWQSDRAKVAIIALRAALAEPVQEQPTCDECGKSKRDGWALYCVDCLEPVFAQRKPLTEEEIYEMYNEPRSDAEMVSFARAIERAHGIGEP